MAVRAEDGYGIILLALLLAPLLRAVPVEDVVDLSAVFQRKDDVFGIPARAVFLRLIAVFHLDAELFEGFHEFLFKVRGVRFVLAEGIGDIRIRAADVLLERIVAEVVGNVFRHLAQAVVFVPRKEHLRLFALSEQGAIDEITRRDVAEISDVHGAGGRNARRAHIDFFIRFSADDLIRQLVSPIHSSFSVAVICIIIAYRGRESKLNGACYGKNAFFRRKTVCLYGFFVL